MSLGRSDSQFDFVDGKLLPFGRGKRKWRKITSGSTAFYVCAYQGKEPNHPASTRSSRQNAKPTFQPRGGETELTEWSSTFVFELTKEKLLNLGKEPRADLRDCRWASMNVRLKSPAKGRSPKCWPQPYLIKGQAL